MNQSIWLFIAGEALAFIGIVFGIYTKIMVKLKELELRVRMVEKQDDSIMRKLDDMAESINDIKLVLENKQDRQKQ